MTTTDRRNGLLGAIAMKAPCKLATTAAITLSGHQSIDGTTTVEDDRVLVKDQGTTTENGIYVASSGNWSRATDFDSGADVENGSMVLVTNGSANANIIYRLNASGDVTIDTTALTFSAVLDTVSVDATLATWLATPTSANLAAAVTNETGSGLLVFGTGR
jgi:phage-related tail fiber protein